MRSPKLFLVVAFLLCVSQASALSLLNKVPAATGKVIGPDGQAVANAKVKVEFLATDDPILSDDKTSYVLKTLETTTDAQGVFSLPETTINATHFKAEFLGAEITASAPGLGKARVTVVNMRAMGGAVGVFVIGYIDAQGDDFDTPFLESVKHAYKTMKESKFSRAYPKALEEPLRLTQDSRDRTRTIQFPKVHRDR